MQNPKKSFANTFRLQPMIKMLGSLKIAVVVILGLCAVVATGTFVESKYDAMAASKWVYRTWWLYSLLLLLIVNLTAVMVDRWPWQKKHAPFIMAHIGIITLLIGAAITVKFGLDGTMRVEIGGKAHSVSVGGTELSLYSSFDGQNYARIYKEPVDFFLDYSAAKPLSIATDDGDIHFLEYLPYAAAEQKVSAVQDDRLGAGVRLQLSNPRVHFVQWLVQRSAQETQQKDLGPARVNLVPKERFPQQGTGRNELFLSPDRDGLRYLISYKDESRKTLKGFVKEGESVQTGWMGIELKIIRFLPQALEETTFQPMPSPTELTNQAMKFEFQGKTHWLQLDDMVKLFTKKAVYILSYTHQKVDTGFDLHLKKFAVGHYPGTGMASSYSSLVEVSELGEKEISMNEPLHYKGQR